MTFSFASSFLAFALVGQSAPSAPAGAQSEPSHSELDCRAGWRELFAEARPASPAFRSPETFGDFELEFEWSPAAGGSIWRATRVVWRDGRCEEWRDGERIFEGVVDGEALRNHLRAGGFRVRDESETTGTALLLPERDDVAAYRAARVRAWSRLPGQWVDLLPADDLTGWRALGDAVYERDGDGILGYVGGGGQSFLVTERTFADFLLEVDVKTELPGNSGIQIRSHVNEAGRLYGYQIEIDPSERAWSAGLYDEARRGWLDDLSDNDAARAAFQHGEWNRYRIECIGPRIQTWINGVPAADYVDNGEEADAEGLIGLQVHSGDNTRVRWRRFRLREL